MFTCCCNTQCTDCTAWEWCMFTCCNTQCTDSTACQWCMFSAHHSPSCRLSRQKHSPAREDVNVLSLRVTYNHDGHTGRRNCLFYVTAFNLWYQLSVPYHSLNQSIQSNVINSEDWTKVTQKTKRVLSAHDHTILYISLISTHSAWYGDFVILWRLKLNK